jgi:hypothetical protein
MKNEFDEYYRCSVLIQHYINLSQKNTKKSSEFYEKYIQRFHYPDLIFCGLLIMHFISNLKTNKPDQVKFHENRIWNRQTIKELVTIQPGWGKVKIQNLLKKLI